MTRAGWWKAGIGALLLAMPAAGESPATALPAVAARPPVAPTVPPTPLLVPAELTALLPPDARVPDAERPPRASQVRRASNGHLVERFETPDPIDPGSDWIELEYTIDADLEASVRKVLEVGRVPLGHVILMDPRDGAILAYVSTDPTSFPGTRTYPTASLMKVVTAAAVLRHSPEAATRECRYAGSPYVVRSAQLEPPRRGGRVDDFWRSLAISNNQCFARMAVHDVGKSAMLAEIERVGMLEAPAPGHSPGRVQPVEDALDLGHLGSGLAGSFISPLAAARLAGLLANGHLVQPYWLAAARDAGGRTLTLPMPASPRSAWPREIHDELRGLLVGVTARGTARSAFRDERGRPMLGDIKVAGKTGSLSGRDPKGRYEWFIGVAPADSPRVVIATVVVNGSLWWSSASQISARVLREIFCAGGHCSAEALDAVLEVAGANGRG